MGCGNSSQKSKGDDGHSRASTNQNRNLNESRCESNESRPQSIGHRQNDNTNESGAGRQPIVDENTHEDNDDNEYYGYDGVQPKPLPEQSPPPPYESREKTPPPEPTPPSPPPREPTPPPREPTPPPREPTPPPRESTPPPREPTPPPRQPTPPSESRRPTPRPDPVHVEDDGEDDTPFDDDGVRDAEGYISNAMGLLEKTTDFRLDNFKEDIERRPHGDPDSLYVDREFPLEIAIVQDSDGIEWKRPKEFLENPTLFTEGTTRFDIGQGSAGTCWFLSTVANVADNERMLRQVIPEGAYRIEDIDAYDGVFHARFFRFGKWEDVYIDDFLPVIYGNVLWGAKSATEEHELWVALLEKAFASHSRFHNFHNIPLPVAVFVFFFSVCVAADFSFGDDNDEDDDDNNSYATDVDEDDANDDHDDNGEDYDKI
ncbi:calpain-9 [Elysia marginata]|uniref:Calpain-9 n=1 Tax=Elysia marginata TaxID=1093978 RepID=A0AAV4I0I4_9GAST|nr:calpain-9 [Elysia marginata]